MSDTVTAKPSTAGMDTVPVTDAPPSVILPLLSESVKKDPPVTLKSPDTAYASVAGSHARSATGFTAKLARTGPLHTPPAKPVTAGGDAPVATREVIRTSGASVLVAGDPVAPVHVLGSTPAVVVAAVSTRGLAIVRALKLAFRVGG